MVSVVCTWYTMPDDIDKTKIDNPVNMPRKIVEKYARIQIPEGLKDEIEKLINDLKEKDISLGYSSISEFVKEAIRRHLSATRKEYQV